MRIIVVGGGPAGMMCAIAAAGRGHSVLLLENNEKTGKKLYITGKGRCNLTNAADRRQFLEHVPHNPRFLNAAYAALPPEALMEFFENLGVPLKIERGGRVFPQSDKSSDVIRALNREMERLGVAVRLHTRVKELILSDGRVTGVRLISGEALPCGWAVLATGGVSYPATGSTGDGFALARAAGHTVHPPRGSLVPLTSPAEWVRGLQGLTLKNVVLAAQEGDKTLFSDMGEMLFTHFGLSGPLALSLSAHLVDRDLSKVAVSIDLKPALSAERLDARLIDEIGENPRRRIEGMLKSLLPGRLSEAVAALCGLDPKMPCHTVTREARRGLCGLLKELPLPVDGFRPVGEAIVTRGGVEVGEISPSGMRSKVAGNLSFAGEVIDVDAYTGGFNLHIAFSTGYLAGMRAGS